MVEAASRQVSCLIERSFLLNFFKENFNSSEEKQKLYRFIERFVNKKETNDSKNIFE